MGKTDVVQIEWSFEDFDGHEEVTAIIRSEGSADAYVTQWRDGVAITVDFAKSDTLAVISCVIRRFIDTGKIWEEKQS